MDERSVMEAVAPEKDVDGASPSNMAKIYSGDDTGFAPCTAAAVIELLDHYQIEISGRRVCVIGRSAVVGRPLALLLLRRDATVTVCHTKTRNLPDVCREADILVSAVGKAKMIGKNFVKPGQIIIDVGMNTDSDGNLCGDVDFEEVFETAEKITPVPGGVGSVTTAVLMKHVVEAGSRCQSLRGEQGSGIRI